jgi:hypothetical protein
MTMLHKTQKIRGFHILATDGEIGHVDEFLVDDRNWAVQYLVVDTSNWIGGRTVLISSAAVKSIDSPNRKIRVRLTRDEIERGPSVDAAQIELVETVPALWIM